MLENKKFAILIIVILILFCECRCRYHTSVALSSRAAISSKTSDILLVNAEGDMTVKQLSDIESRLSNIEGTYATQQWVNDKGYATEKCENAKANNVAGRLATSRSLAFAAVFGMCSMTTKDEALIDIPGNREGHRSKNS